MPGSHPWMQDYNEVRAAGWTFVREVRRWRHTSGVWTTCRQSTLLMHLRAGTEVPLVPEPILEGALSAHVGRVINETRAYARVHRPRAAISKVAADWQPNFWEG